DVAAPEIGAHMVDLRQRDAGDAGDAGAEAEREGVDAAGANAHRSRHGAVLRYGAHFKAQPREAQHAEEGNEYREGEADDPYPIVSDVEMADLEGAAHPGRVRDFTIGRPEGCAHGLLEDKRQAPGGEQGFERTAIQETDDAALNQDADRCCDDEGRRYRDDQ